ncbi:hypothetical protein [Limnofasciculus baicalensis]|uniref:Uncharacterized protein n=1 Tax=Limnofasciculus baicalensis BBK-W-15 TaxID=2699891 RepID=A0AAE3GS95_9CYAN|nr:hypothetical protein [Limnofasciculus baicalensis]MCP2729574.1 hypothetical protein [Limnofasciculus baicalensis BBK-W-15]
MSPYRAGESLIIADPWVRGYKYLEAMQQLALIPDMVDVRENSSVGDRICGWIGKYIDTINAELRACLEACHGCFHSELRRPIQIWATPLSEEFGIDGFCNILLDPTVILIDVGRTSPDDWLSIVVHEYAHAHIGSPGHDIRFFEVLSHLCLGLGLPPPVWQPDIEDYLKNWPYCPSRANPLSFWMGYV